MCISGRTGDHDHQNSRSWQKTRHFGPRLARLRPGAAIHGRLQPYSLERTEELRAVRSSSEDLLSPPGPAAAIRLQDSPTNTFHDAVVRASGKQQLAGVRLHRSTDQSTRPVWLAL